MVGFQGVPDFWIVGEEVKIRGFGRYGQGGRDWAWTGEVEGSLED